MGVAAAYIPVRGVCLPSCRDCTPPAGADEAGRAAEATGRQTEAVWITVLRRDSGQPLSEPDAIPVWGNEAGGEGVCGVIEGVRVCGCEGVCSVKVCGKIEGVM